jgi:hypothetical protein
MAMKRMGVLLGFLLVGAVCFAPEALPASNEKEFQKVKKMDLRELTSATQAAMEKKYPDEKWEKYKFPKYVYIHPAVTLGYKIAVKDPELLARFPCYCMCDVMGHQNLFYCFVEKGIPGGKFDEHASACNICVTEAMRGFLWKELGASEEEMLKALKEIYKE